MTFLQQEIALGSPELVLVEYVLNFLSAGSDWPLDKLDST